MLENDFYHIKDFIVLFLVDKLNPILHSFSGTKMPCFKRDRYDQSHIRKTVLWKILDIAEQ